MCCKCSRLCDVGKSMIVAICLLCTGCSENSAFQLHDASARKELGALAHAHFEKHGLFSEGDFFTRFYRRGGGEGKVYHLKNAEMGFAAEFSYLSKADRLNGIDLRTTVLLRGDAYREKAPAGKWSDWHRGVGPVSQLGLRAERRNGVFSLNVSSNADFFRRPSPSETS